MKTMRSDNFDAPATCPTTLVELLRARSEHEPGRTAYLFLADSRAEAVSITCGELDRRARALAAHLLRTRAAPGARALLLYPAGLEYVVAFFGCLYAGVVAVPAYPPRANRNLARLEAMAADAQAHFALTTKSLFARTQAALAQSPQLAQLSLIATDEPAADMADATELFTPAVVRGDDLAYLQYTSGSTALPKGVMVTHANVLHNSADIHQGFAHTKASVALSWLPHFHDMGLIDGIIQPLYGGFTGILMPPTSFLQRPACWLEAVTRFQVTHTGGPNFAYDLCVRRIPPAQRAALNLGSWAVAYNGAEPVHADTLKRFAAAFAPCGFRERVFYPAYGLAEATLKVSGGERDAGPVYLDVDASALAQHRVVLATDATPAARTLVGAGRAPAGTEVSIVEPEARRRVAPDSIGEVWVRGPGVAAGYWQRADETAQTFHARLADTDEGPFLRTGDLGFIHDGELFITGRRKDLIIIRGRNHYPQDIERSVEQAHAALRPGGAAAFSVEGAGAEQLVVLQELEDRRTTEISSIVERIRARVAEEFEVQPTAILLLKPGSVPKTSSGKVQRAACRQMFLAGAFQPVAEWHAVEDDDDEQLPELTPAPLDWSEPAVTDWLRAQLAAQLRLAPEEIADDRPLCAYALDSLQALELTHRFETGLGVSLSLTDLLQEQTLAQLTEQLLAQRAAQDTLPVVPGAAQAADSTQLLTHGQQALWFLHRLAPESAAYHIAVALKLHGACDTAALRRVFQRLTERHAALRTTFPAVAGQPVQQVAEQQEVYFLTEDAAHWSDATLAARLRAETERPFDLERGPLLRVTLLKRAAHEHVLHLVAHHIIADFWSLAVLMHELGSLYRAETTGASVELPDASTPLTVFAARQRALLASDAGAQHLAYWQQQLAGDLPVLELPTDRPRPPVQTYAGATLHLRLSPELTDRLKALSRAHGATLYMTLLAAFQTLLYRHTGQDDLLIGTPTSGRNSVETAGGVGYFVNPVVLRAPLSGRLTFAEFLAGVRRTVLAAFAHQDYPFDLLVKHLQPQRDPSRSPLFQAMFTLQRAHLLTDEGLAAFALGTAGARLELGGLKFESMALAQPVAQFDLALTMAEVGGELAAAFEYNTDLFDAATIARLSERFHVLLAALAADPQQRLDHLAILTPHERRQLLDEWSAPAASVNQPTDAPLVHELFAQQAARASQQTAVRVGDAELSYAELDARANQLAHTLRARGVGPDVPVGLCVNRSSEMLVGMLAVLKAGGAYVPLDPAYPAERLAYMLADSGARVLLTEAALAAASPAHDAEVIRLDADWPAIAQARTDAPQVRVAPANLAYVIYTSGSTGRPKGVMVSHGSLASYTQIAARQYETGAHDRVLQFASYSFDASAEEIYPALITGATLVHCPPAAQSAHAAFIAFCRAEAITVLDLPTAFWHELAAALTPDDWAQLPHLRLVIIGGEQAQREPLRAWHERTGGRIRLVNTYGPTETTIVATSCDLSRPPAANDDNVPIGRPIPHARAYVLSAAREPVPAGVRGELYIGGAGLARGYLNGPDLTAERFSPDPFATVPGARLYQTGDLARFRADGQIEFLGRADDQVKVRGYRIELGEIEAALRQHARVAAAVVGAHTEGRQTRLIAYVVPRGDAQPTTRELREFLAARLPAHMLPAAFVTLAELPLTPSGKLDRRALPAPEMMRAAPAESFVAPHSAAERQLCAIWADILKVERVGLNDNFFELGGDSILSILMIARAQQAGIHIAPRQVFEHPTVAGLLRVAGQTAHPVATVQRDPDAPAPLTPIQQWFFAQDFPAPHHWNMALLLAPRARLDFAPLAQAVAHLFAQHDSLRLRFNETDGRWQQTVAPHDATAAPLQLVDLTRADEVEQRAAIEQTAAETQTQLDFTRGPVLRAVLFELGPDRPQRLLVVAHHLVIDGVSWRILLADLEQAYRRLAAGAEPEPLPRTTPFTTWAQLLDEYARGADLSDEAKYWARLADVNVQPLPVDEPAGANVEGSARTVGVELSVAETRALLQAVPRAYHTQIVEVLLTALAEACAEWTGARTLLVELEGHGREELFAGVDLARTVGWFTTAFPIALDLRAATAPGAALKSVKEQLRAVPRGGIGYGLLRYSATPADPRAPAPEISFNYLGQLDQMLGDAALFALASESSGPVRDPRAARSHLLEVNAVVLGGRLRLDWTYSEHVHARATVERLTDAFMRALRALIGHCLTPGVGGHTPADFPLARLDQRQLDELLGTRREVVDIYPLSPMQQGILFHSLYEPEADVYVGQVSLRLEGPLDADAFARAWQRVVAAHTILRTSFAWADLDEPLQLVHAHAPLAFAQHDWRALSAAEQTARLTELHAAEQARAFDLAAPPLMRLALVRLDAETAQLVWTLHHLLLDGWSLSLLLQEVWALYETFRRDDEPPVTPERRPYRDYVAWLRRQDMTRAETFWRATLKGFTAPTPLVIDRDVRAAQTAAPPAPPAVVRAQLTIELTERLRALARTQQLTLNTLVQGAWALLLSRYGREADVVFGATMAGRPPALAGVDEMVGLFINTLPVRARVEADAPVLAWLKQFQTEQARLREYEYSPLAEVQGWSDVPRGQSLFASLLVFENYPVEVAAGAQGADLRLGAVTSFDRTNYPLTIIVAPGRELAVQAVYDAQRFDAAAIERLVQHLLTLLTALADDPAQRISELRLLSTAERRQLLAEWNDTRRPYPRGQLIHELFEAQVRAQPEATAVVHGGAQLTYEQLNARANRLAHHLRALGVGPEVPVGICTSRSIEMLVGLLGILKAGGAYVPLDPTYPQERLAFMLADSGVRVLLTETSVRAALPPHEAHVIVLDDDQATTAAPATNPSAGLTAENLAYIIYTSGSTGRPKGVAITHRSAVAFSYWARASFAPEVFKGTLALSSICFDLSIFELFVPLHCGGTVLLVENVLHIASVPPTHEVTLVNTVPSAVGELLRLGLLPPTAATINLAGEPLAGKLVRQLYEQPQVRAVYNLYGPTEDTTYSTWGLMSRAEESPSIGRPIHNTRVYLLDGAGEPVPVGIAGELHLGGDGLARGYLGRPDQTAERFVPDPFSSESGARLYRTGDLARYRPDGQIEFLGRADYQVKIRGYRIELGEIEAVLQAHAGVRDCAVLAREDAPGDIRLVAYVAPAAGALSAAELRAYLKSKLLEHMVPAVFVLLPELPLTPNGKINRRALPAPASVRPETTEQFIAPRNAVEAVLADIWAQVLGVGRVGAADNFFELGGHSLLATRALARINQTFRMQLPLQAVFTAGTLAELARLVAAHETRPGQAEKIARARLKVQQMSAGELQAELERKRKQREATHG
jgi:amino acid adenylation domain-containing protein/non-ribosomal peptide synthase protein (TIGR01720 family)